MHSYGSIPVGTTVDTAVGTPVITLTNEFVRIFRRYEVSISNRSVEFTFVFRCHRHIHGCNCKGSCFTSSGIHKVLSATEIKVETALVHAPAGSLLYKIADNLFMLSRKVIFCAFENRHPERYSIYESHSIVTELNLRTMLMERPIWLDTLTFCNKNCFLNLSACSLYYSLVIDKESSHEVVSCKPHLVLTSSPELCLCQDLQATLKFLRSKLITEHKQHGCIFLRHSDLVMPPVRAYRHKVIPILDTAMQKFLKLF